MPDDGLDLFSSLEDDGVSPLYKSGDDDGLSQTARLVIKPAPEERELLDRVMRLTGYPSQRAVIFDALRDFEMAVESGMRSSGSLVDFESRLARLEQGVEDDRVLLGRMLSLLPAYQRGFQLFTLLHESLYAGEVSS
ncbi:hypothetical protein OH491_24060 [Termitidicoccus mucosus]